MRASANMESPPVRNDLRFIVGLLPFGNSLTLGCEITVSSSLRGIQKTVLFRIHSYADSVSGHNRNRPIRHLPVIRFCVGERCAASSQCRRVWTGSHSTTVCSRRSSRPEESPELAACHLTHRQVYAPALFRHAMHDAQCPNRPGRAA